MTILKTPVGSTLFASLTEAVVFSPTGKAKPTPEEPGHFETLLVLDPSKKDVESFLDELASAADEAASTTGGKNRRDPLYSLTDDVDENKAPTGYVRLKFRCPAGGTTKTGKKWSTTVPMFDAVGQPMEPEAELANGSKIRVSFELRPYSTGGLTGVSLRLRAVQVVAAEYKTASVVNDFAGEEAPAENFDF
jgi:hypothetical protein